MRTRLANRRAAQHSAPASSAPCWLLRLPGLAQQAVVAQLREGDRRSLRLTCKPATALVDACALRLRLSGEELVAGGTQLQQRFPCAAWLALRGFTGRRRFRKAAPWPAVTALDVSYGSMRMAAHLAASFANLQHLHLSCISSSPGDLPLETLCQQLPHVATLQLSHWQRLGDEELSALARLPVRLTALQSRLEVISAAGCSALAAMTALQSLNLRYDELQAMISVDLRGLTALTALAWKSAGHADWDDNFGWSLNTALQLPTSLVQLHMQRLPAALPSGRLLPTIEGLWACALPALPHLTSLVLTHQRVGREELAIMAASCSALASLQVPAAMLCTACHAAQLTALTDLTIVKELETQGDVRLAAVFPQLRALALSCDIDANDDELDALQGLTSLERLDVGREAVFDAGSDGASGLLLSQAEFEVLAALPLLRTLRLNLTPEHVEGLCLLTQLHSMEWVWDASQCFAQGFQCTFELGQTTPPEIVPERSGVELAAEAFDVCSAPAQLQEVALIVDATKLCKFSHSHKLKARVASLSGMIDAAIGFLARAPAIRTVRWTSDVEVAWLTPARLAALAASPTIQHITIDMQHSAMPVPPAYQLAVQAFKRDGLQVALVV